MKVLVIKEKLDAAKFHKIFPDFQWIHLSKYEELQSYLQDKTQDSSKSLLLLDENILGVGSWVNVLNQIKAQPNWRSLPIGVISQNLSEEEMVFLGAHGKIPNLDSIPELKNLLQSLRFHLELPFAMDSFDSEFVRKSHVVCQKILELASLVSPVQKSDTYGLVHALKGDAYILELPFVGQLLHFTEEIFAHLPTRRLENTEQKTLNSVLKNISDYLTNLSRQIQLKEVIDIPDSNLLDEIHDLVYYFENQNIVDYVKSPLFKKDNGSLINEEVSSAPSSIRLEKLSSMSLKNYCDLLVKSYSLRKKKSVKLEFYLDKAIAFNEENERLIREIIGFFIKNSIDHGIEDEMNRLEKGKPSRGLLGINIYSEKNSLVISIKDDGRGISGDMENFEMIFEPGFSTKSGPADVLSGRGMGLSAAKEKIEDVKGSISITSHSNKGAEFKIVLPA